MIGAQAGGGTVPAFRTRIAAAYGLLIAGNVGAWAWALTAFHGHPALLATALVAYGLGLRHAVDADHIAAIDNVTRKLMQAGDRPVGVGLFFALGHSSVVLAASVAVAATSAAVQARLAWLADLGVPFGALVSGAFLLTIASMNGLVLIDVWRRLRAARSGAEEPGPAAAGGLLFRLLGPAARLVSRSWHMFPLGFLFGLGFDTATEIALLGLSAASATNGLPLGSILVFPALFTAAMSMVDTTDGVLMLAAYGWAAVEPRRKLLYNLAITLLSILVAVVVAGIELGGLVSSRFSEAGATGRLVGVLNDNLDAVGLAVVGLFLSVWLGFALVHRLRARPARDRWLQT